MEPDVAVNVRTRLEKVRLDFVVSQVQIAHTFANTAEALYRSGSTAQAAWAAGIAYECCEEARHRLSELVLPRRMHDSLVFHLDRVCEALDALTVHFRRLRE